MGTTPMAEILNGMNRTTSQSILARASHCSNIALTSELLAVCNEPPSLVFIMYRLMLSVLDFSLKAQAGRLDCLILENQENRSMSKIATKAIDC